MATLDRPAAALDDRGRSITVLAPRDLKKAAEGADTHRASLARHLRNAIKVESRRWTVAGVLVPLGMSAAWIAALVFIRFIRVHRIPGASMAVFWGGIAAIILVSRVMARRRVSRELAATAVAEGLCGSCCYGLRDIPVDADGCVVCPECGAAWMKQRITRPYWLGSVRSRAEGGRAGKGWLVRFVTATPPPSQLLGPDDRGRFVSVVDSRLLLLSNERRDELGIARCRELRRMLRRVGAVPRMLVSLAPGAILAMLMLGLFTQLREPDIALRVVLLAGTLLFGAVTAGVNLGHGFYSPRRAARVLASKGLCASCLHDLEELAPESDGCVVCPECGASWRAAAGAQKAEAGPTIG